MPKNDTYLKGWYKLRWKILERDNFTCRYCGQSAPDVRLEVDHIVAVADGGTADEDNLTASCWACNRGKNGLRQSIVLKAKRIKERIKERDSGKVGKEIERILKESSTSLKACEIVKRMDGYNPASIRVILSRLLKRQRVKKEGRLWSCSESVVGV